MRRVFSFILATMLAGTPARAQEDREYGKILAVSGRTATVQFERGDVSVGDEIEFWRFKRIVDPVSGVERGSTKALVGRGVVDEIGLGKASVTITEQTGSERIAASDRALPTGEKKKMTRKTARIQEISADKQNMVIDLGSRDEISEGDMFLIQRTENIYDPKTNAVTGTSQIDIGRGRVSAVRERTSTAAITEVKPGREVLTSDTIVFGPESRQTSPAPGEVARLQDEIDGLKREVAALKVTVDSLAAGQARHEREYLDLKKEIESVIPHLVSLDAAADRIAMKNAETILVKRPAGDVAARYRRALDDCLKHRIARAADEFQRILDDYPDLALAENCRYWIAQCRFAEKNYSAAAAGFQSVLDDTRFTHKDDDASIMLGVTFFQMGRLQEALDRLHRFVEDFPASEYRERVERWIERISLIKSRG